MTNPENASTFFCIYSGKDWPESERSDEHIVPYALGGNNKLVTRDVAKIPNNVCGQTADASLINSFMISSDRWRLKIASESGHIPPIVFDGTVELAGKQVRAKYTINPDMTKELRIVPSVEGSIAEGRYQVLADPKDGAAIFANISKKAAKQGLKLLPLGDLSSQIQRVDQPAMQVSFEFRVDMLALGFIKMALGLGHLVLGYDWSRSSSASALRDALNAPQPIDWDNFKIPGGVWPSGVPGFTPILRLDDDHHVFMLQNDESGLKFYGLLFGKFDGLISLHGEKWETSEIPHGGLIFLVSPAKRTFERLSFGEYLKRRNAV